MNDKLFKLVDKPEFGLLLLRAVLGVIMICHGVPKFLGGASTLEGIGKAMSVIGVENYPLFWGFMAAFTETLGGFFLILGFYFRLSSFLLAFVMGLGAYMLYLKGSALALYGHPLVLFAVFFAFIFMGPGQYSVDKK